VDFWGDRDLFRVTDEVYTVFKPEHVSYSTFPNSRLNAENLVKLALQVISKREIEGVLIGSGLDDRPDLWQKIAFRAPILGNTPDQVKAVRNLTQLQTRFRRENIKFPKTLKPANFHEIDRLAMEIGFPLVLKPKETMGGVGIFLIKNSSELRTFFQTSERSFRDFYIQAYIKGKNISATMVGDGSEYRVLSINEQLIGVQEFGTKLPFKYCGNIIPFLCSPEAEREIHKVSIYISKMFQLSGIFGIDFVLGGNIPYFMEINPRFPGTIELLQLVSETNSVKVHLDAVEGQIPKHFGKIKGVAMKAVLFARNPLITPNLEDIRNITDVPFPDLRLSPEDPICCIQMRDESREKLRERIKFRVNQVFYKCEKQKILE
jgi:predicted ATP-grasp superfamily ATP-dependent carboligase